jgi:carboxyl-terminal processing protease
MEQGAAVAFRTLLDQLAEQKARGLILDLRWNPGGYVSQAYQIAGQFLKPDQIITKVTYRRPDLQNQPEPRPPAAEGREWELSLPLAVLVNAETTGGGELLAAAFQDHKRAIVVGQRTAGKAAVMTSFDTPFPGVVYRVTTGYSLRPNGKSRQRLPTSRPWDEWGIRPDPGCEIPTTPAYSRRLQEWAEWQACRPADAKAALPLDDPLNDPQRMLAERLLLAHVAGRE